MDHKLPRDIKQSHLIDQSKIGSYIILCNADSGVKYIIANSVDSNEFYFEKCDAKLISDSGLSGVQDRTLVFSNIIDDIKRGNEAEAKLDMLRKILK